MIANALKSFWSALFLLGAIFIGFLSHPVMASAENELAKSEAYRVLFVFGRHSNSAKMLLLKRAIKDNGYMESFVLSSKADKDLGIFPKL